jgi:uncharacterized secreted protein with C-terminal beta-propeller domain
MKSYNELTQTIQAKLSAKRRQRRRNLTAVVSMVCCLVLVAGIILTNPALNSPLSPTNPVRTTKPSNRDYTKLVQVLKNMDSIKGSIQSRPILGIPEVDAPVATPDEGISGPTLGDTEITDNQVEGVTEADIIKRSNDHIFYLHKQSLQIYSIAGADSTQVSTYDLPKAIGWKEMFLSVDNSTVTLIGVSESGTWGNLYVINLNVTDPLNIKEIGQMTLTGLYKSARFTDGYLYLFTRYYIPRDCDFTKPETFLPRYGTDENMTELLMDEIIIGENPDTAVYAVITRLDPVTLEMEDTLALLGYGSNLYVSQDNIYMTRNFSEKPSGTESSIYRKMTEISRINYTDEEMQLTGCMKLEGNVLNQYSMDEKDGILRVVTTVEGFTAITNGFSDHMMQVTDSYTNASLYCVDFDNNQIIAKVERFAPDGERVQSVRFDGDKAYVCTSIELTDPVFCFDLSDLSNITWRDTGTIDGFSSSLVDMGNGFLLGLGIGSSWNTVKIEVYREGQTAMEPYCSYEVENAYISTDYKAYYIDRSNQFVGLGISIYNGHIYNSNYLLLHFDGTQLVQKVMIPLCGNVAEMRGVYIDGWLYMFGEAFKVVPIS